MLEFVNKYLIGTSVPALLIFAGIFYLVRLNFRPLKTPIKMIKIMLAPNEDEKKGISPFRSVTMALAGTLGVGNIVGVAGAISLGGFGAVFWMWVSALAAMILKYAEITLAVAHRPSTDGEHHGGAMYYIKDFYLRKDRPVRGKVLACLFAVLCVTVSLGMGCVVQVNAVSSSFKGVFNVPAWICGAVLTVMTAAVITKGAKGISKLTELLVPFMSLGYIAMSVAVMIICRDRLPKAIGKIFSDAFTVRSSVGGILGFLFSDAVRYGTMRGLLSNEAGCGTAPLAHAASSTLEPAKQGTWGIFEVFVDTIILCTMTAVVIIVNYDDACAFASNGIMMTVKAYSATLGKSAEYFLCAAVLLFAYATVICWAHYGVECVSYIFKNKKLYARIFYIVFCIFTFVGAIVAPEAVWSVVDLSIGSMTVINVLVVCFMSGEVKELTERIFKDK